MADAINSLKLVSYVERIERLEEDMKQTGEEKKELYAELKSEGYEPKYVRKAISLRKQDAEKRQLEEAEFQPYAAALGIE